METTTVYWGNRGIKENEMETTIVYWGNIGIMEKKKKILLYLGVKGFGRMALKKIQLLGFVWAAEPIGEIHELLL